MSKTIEAWNVKLKKFDTMKIDRVVYTLTTNGNKRYRIEGTGTNGGKMVTFTNEAGAQKYAKAIGKKAFEVQPKVKPEPKGDRRPRRTCEKKAEECIAKRVEREAAKPPKAKRGRKAKSKTAKRSSSAARASSAKRSSSASRASSARESLKEDIKEAVAAACPVKMTAAAKTKVAQKIAARLSSGKSKAAAKGKKRASSGKTKAAKGKAKKHNFDDDEEGDMDYNMEW